MLEEGDLVLCTVDRIVGTTVFVKTESGEEGTIITSEIAPGRIRNLRDYVVPNKKIVCKVLRISGGNLNFSLRRVSGKERKTVLDKYNQERTALSILKTVLGNKSEKTVTEIKKKSGVYDFLQNCKSNPAELEKLMDKGEAARVCKILQEKKEKPKEMKKEFKLTSSSSEGIRIIKDILSECACEITYLGSGKYTIKITSPSIKEADKLVASALEKIQSKAKSAKADFELIEKKK